MGIPRLRARPAKKLKERDAATAAPLPFAPSSNGARCHAHHSSPGSSTGGKPRVDMAIPTFAMNNIYDVNRCLEETDTITYGALNSQKLMKTLIRQQRDKLLDLRARLLADIEDGPALPQATQMERMRRMQHITTYLYWLENTEEAINNAIRVLRCHPRRSGLITDEEVMA